MAIPTPKVVTNPDGIQIPFSFIITLRASKLLLRSSLQIRDGSKSSLIGTLFSLVNGWAAGRAAEDLNAGAPYRDLKHAGSS